jgi:hypothetical protein
MGVLSKSAWFKYGFWNTLEHGLIRVSDALTSIVLLWALSAETFSMLALAQAFVAPLLLLFVSPETVLYRDFGRWEAQGADLLASRIRALRLFAWGKAQIALFLSVGIAFVLPGTNGYWIRFSAVIWAFALA